MRRLVVVRLRPRGFCFARATLMRGQRNPVGETGKRGHHPLGSAGPLGVPAQNQERAMNRKRSREGHRGAKRSTPAGTKNLRSQVTPRRIRIHRCEKQTPGTRPIPGNHHRPHPNINILRISQQIRNPLPLPQSTSLRIGQVHRRHQSQRRRAALHSRWSPRSPRGRIIPAQGGPCRCTSVPPRRPRGSGRTR